MAFPAKVLLFGEHTVLRGGRGLAIPYPKLFLNWQQGEVDERLPGLAAYLRNQYPASFHHDRLAADLAEGWRLVGNIPTGYGLGSSGAVCAAVLDRYGTPYAHKTPPAALRELLSGMEGHYHGSSSGTDPLVSYLSQPLLLSSDGRVQTVELPQDWPDGFYLVDTGPRQRRAATLIATFLKAYTDRPGEIDHHWRDPTDAAIAALVAGQREDLHTHFAKLSYYQRTAFVDFFPREYLGYPLKLCGAGGGGMLLGLTDDPGWAEVTFGDRLRWLR